MVHLFAASDDDHDDQLSFSEVLEHYDIFVGSEATDYGDHLHNIHHFSDELWYGILCVAICYQCMFNENVVLIY